MTDDEIRDSARGIVLGWIAECALMLRVDQPPDTQGTCWGAGFKAMAQAGAIENLPWWPKEGL